MCREKQTQTCDTYYKEVNETIKLIKTNAINGIESVKETAPEYLSKIRLKDSMHRRLGGT